MLGAYFTRYVKRQRGARIVEELSAENA